MNELEVIAEFKLDTTVDLLKILWNKNIYDLSYKMLCQWKESDWLHIISICIDKELIIELRYDCDVVWEIFKFESLN